MKLVGVLIACALLCSCGTIDIPDIPDVPVDPPPGPDPSTPSNTTASLPAGSILYGPPKFWYEADAHVWQAGNQEHRLDGSLIESWGQPGFAYPDNPDAYWTRLNRLVAEAREHGQILLVYVANGKGAIDDYLGIRRFWLRRIRRVEDETTSLRLMLAKSPEKVRAIVDRMERELPHDTVILGGISEPNSKAMRALDEYVRKTWTGAHLYNGTDGDGRPDETPDWADVVDYHVHSAGQVGPKGRKRMASTDVCQSCFSDSAGTRMEPAAVSAHAKVVHSAGVIFNAYAVKARVYQPEVARALGQIRYTYDPAKTGTLHGVRSAFVGDPHTTCALPAAP